MSTLAPELNETNTAYLPEIQIKITRKENNRYKVSVTHKELRVKKKFEILKDQTVWLLYTSEGGYVGRSYSNPFSAIEFLSFNFLKY